MKNPTWSELRHYVYFLSSQLFKIEASSFTSLAVVEDLPGFRKFVVNFMFRMAQVSDGFISYLQLYCGELVMSSQDALWQW